MFSRGRRSNANAVAANSNSSPPAAVILSNSDNDGCSSASEDGLERSFNDYGSDSVISRDDSYGKNFSNDKSKQGKKKLAQKRSLVDQLRLLFLTGRLSRLVVHGSMLLALGLTTYAITSKLLHLLLENDRGVALGLEVKPTMMAMYFTDVSSRSFTGRVDRIIPPRTQEQWVHMLGKQRLHKQYNHHQQPHVITSVTPLSRDLEQIEEGSEYYEDNKPEITPNPDKCTPQYEWQTTTFPACNSVHENTMMWDRMYMRPNNNNAELHSHDHHHDHHHSHGLRRRLLLETPPTAELKDQFKYLAHGYWRDTWMLQTPGEKLAFKTMRLKHDLTEYLMDKQRRDAVTSDRLTFSKHAIHMYGYCGTSALYEFAPGGDLQKLIEKFDTATDFTEYYSPAERLLLAFNVTSALADVHTTEGPQTNPAIVHGDFKSDQFVAVTTADDPGEEEEESDHHKLPHFKLGDFNLARFVFWNEEHHHPCVIKPDGNGGKNRAPEEYAKAKGRTEKLDIYR